MVDPETIDKLLDLPAEAKPAVAKALRESLTVELAGHPLPPWHREILEKRLVEDDVDAVACERWDVVRRRIEGDLWRLKSPFSVPHLTI